MMAKNGAQNTSTMSENVSPEADEKCATRKAFLASPFLAIG